MDRLLTEFDEDYHDIYRLDCATAANKREEYQPPDVAEEVGNFCLRDIRTAFGKTVVLSEDGKYPYSIKDSKARSTEVKVIIALTFITVILLPFMCLVWSIGLLATHLSKTHKKAYHLFKSLSSEDASFQAKPVVEQKSGSGGQKEVAFQVKRTHSVEKELKPCKRNQKSCSEVERLQARGQELYSDNSSDNFLEAKKRRAPALVQIKV